MRYRLATLFFIITAFVANAAIDVSFENGVPTEWKSANGSLSTSDFHYKDGTKSLQWDWQSKDVLTVTNLQSQGLVKSQVEGYYDHTFYMWVYNPVRNDKDSVVVSFYDANNILQYHYYFYLNYKGWRPVSISYLKEMFGAKVSQNLTKMTISAPENRSGSFFIDRIDFTGERIERSAPSTHLPYKPNWDKNHWSDMYRYSNLPRAYGGEQATADELADLQSLKTYVHNYLKGSAPSSSNLNAANNVYNKLNISENPDGTLKGYVLQGMNGTGAEKIEFINDIILHYARDFAHRGTLDSRTKFMKIIRHVLDQGYHYGCMMESMHHVGYQFRKYPQAVLLMESELKKEGIWEDAYAMVTWFVALDGIWDSSAETSNMDAGNTRTVARYLSIFFKETKAEQVQYLKGFRDYIQTWAIPHPRLGEGIKTDYTGFHHNFYYPARYVNPAYKSLSWAVNKMAGTAFAVNSNAKDVLKKAMLVSRLNSNGKDMPMALSGRGNPFTNINSAVDGMRDIALSYQPAERQLAEMINLVEPGSSISGFGKENDPNGFWQLNYGTMGVYRKNTWVANLTGFNNNFMGQEIYSGTSQFARYSSYGAIEVLYSGGNSVSGRNINGWNWNATPGATTIFLPWEKLDANGREDEKTDSKLAGALRFGAKDTYYLEDENLIEGEIGLFAMDFKQKNLSANHNTSFTFKKSVFCIDGKMICLGSGINNNDTQNMTATTLFQNYLSTTSKSVVVNGTENTRFPFDEILDVSADKAWLINAVGTGYYLPNQGNTIEVFKRNQTSPQENGKGGTTSGNSALAYINHGKAPVNASYEFVVIPQTTTSKMETLVNGMDDYYSVLMNNTKGHVVACNLHEAYALFSANTNIPNALLKSNSATCLSIIKREKNGNVTCSVNNPILKFGADGNTLSEEIELAFNGDWKLEAGSTGVVFKEFKDEVSVLIVTVKNGEPTDFRLIPNSIVVPESISISTETLELSAPEKVTLSETILPESATNKEVFWVSENEAIATVDVNGEVTAVAAGLATITVSTHDYKYSATCLVTVTKALDLTYVETLENVSYSGWGNETYTGDNGFQWTANGKGVSGYIADTKELYHKNNTILSSGSIEGGISSFSMDCMNKWNDGSECSIELLANGNVVGSKVTTSQDEAYKFELNGLNIAGDINLDIKIGANTIVIDNITWTTYLNPLTAINRNEETDILAVYPNPFQSTLSIKNDGRFSEAKLFNLSGQVLMNIPLEGTVNLSLSPSYAQMPRGMYLLQLNGAEKIATAKILRN